MTVLQLQWFKRPFVTIVIKLTFVKRTLVMPGIREGETRLLNLLTNALNTSFSEMEKRMMFDIDIDFEDK